MLTLCTLLPSDNMRILGRFEGFADLLLRASDNIPILLENEYMLYIYRLCPPIEKSTHSNSDKYNAIYYLSIIYLTIVYYPIVYRAIIYGMTKYSDLGLFYTHVRSPPPPKI